MRMFLTLRIRGDHLNPDEVTRILGVSPHASWRKGDRHVTRPNKEVVRRYGVWDWASKDESGALTVDGHVARLRSTFQHAIERLPQLPDVESAWIDLHVVVGDEDEAVSNLSFLMGTEAISTLSGIGLPMEVTVDILPPREEMLEAKAV
jgi:hypothetical protein